VVAVIEKPETNGGKDANDLNDMKAFPFRVVKKAQF
jgi:hypothetical protein